MSRPVRRGLLIALSLSALSPGLWALLAPRLFHDSFPGLGLRWVGSLGPYDEHLVRDVGAFYLALAVLTVCAARSLEHELVRTTALVWLVFQLPHLAAHVQLAQRYDASTALQLLTLLLQLAVPVVVLVDSRAARGGRWMRAQAPPDSAGRRME